MTRADVALRAAGLVRFGAVAAVIGGGLRIVSSFVPYEAGSATLETLYGVIDLCLLFGLLAVYVASAEVVGMFGLAMFLVALAGVASIVGPDAQAFGIDFYRVGALVFVIGLAGLSVQLVRARRMMASAALWTATPVASLASIALPQAFLAAGICIGAGYVAAGLSLLRERRVLALIPA
ncbi:MAG TPA: hypothetical protein PLH23_18795 [Hyphomonadaceae bacterium]|nr:hypothetical protein [Hyphomonadaceae bacterium]HPI50328.1 hypothetical protein [Hyphomonadaceae bacterium]